MTSFTDKAKAAAEEDLRKCQPIHWSSVSSIQRRLDSAFLSGATFGRAETVKEVLEMLRNEESSEVADWLEAKLKER